MTSKMQSLARKVLARFVTATDKQWFTPAQIKKEGLRIGEALDFGHSWKFHGVQKSNRQVIGGREQALVVKFFSEDNSGVAELGVFALASGAKTSYTGTLHVEIRGKAVKHETHSVDSFEALVSWVKSLPAG